jgi:tetratricopeptide (TPR) repeat protein
LILLKYFSIGFLEINSRTDLDSLKESLKQHPDCQNIQFEVFDFTNQEIRFLHDVLAKKLLTVQIMPVKKLVIMLRGLEDSIGIIGDYPPILQNINFFREGFSSTIPHPLIFCLPDYAITRFIKFAPDFWAWKAGVFDFKTVSDFDATPITQNIFIERLFEKGLEKQTDIDTLHRLLKENTPLPEQTENHCLQSRSRLTILTQLGTAYRHLGNSQTALEYLQKALKLVNLDRKLNYIPKAALLHELGIVYVTSEQFDTAIAFFQQALEIRQHISDFQGQAETLSQMAQAYISQGELEKAMSRFQPALAITQEIKDIHGQAAILHQMAKFYASQSHYEEAIASYEKLLQIYTRQTFPENWAMTVNNLGIVYSERTLGKKAENLEHAIDYYRQALQVYTRDAFPQQWAITQNNLGNAYQVRLFREKSHNLELAIHCYQQALQVHTREASPQYYAIIQSNLGFASEQNNQLQLLAQDSFAETVETVP